MDWEKSSEEMKKRIAQETPSDNTMEREREGEREREREKEREREMHCTERWCHSHASLRHPSLSFSSTCGRPGDVTAKCREDRRQGNQGRQVCFENAMQKKKTRKGRRRRGERRRRKDGRTACGRRSTIHV